MGWVKERLYLNNITCKLILWRHLFKAVICRNLVLHFDKYFYYSTCCGTISKSRILLHPLCHGLDCIIWESIMLWTNILVSKSVFPTHLVTFLTVCLGSVLYVLIFV